MQRSRRLVFLVALALLLAAGAGAYAWLTAREPVPTHSDFVLDMAELRRLATSLPGRKPLRVRSELVAETSLPRAAVFAGESFDAHPMVHQVFQIQFEDGYLLLDAAFPEAMLARMGGGSYHADGFARVREALGRARMVLLTHEHFDHLAGLAALDPAADLGDRVRLTREQLGNTEQLDEAELPDALRSAMRPFDYDGAVAVAPGVAVQKAPGHTPGSQLIFVMTESGTEYLFVGDIAWHLDQIVNRHYRPRFVTNLFLGEDRHAVLAQFHALSELLRGEQNLIVVVSHDRDERQRLLDFSWIEDGIELAPAAQ